MMNKKMSLLMMVSASLAVSACGKKEITDLPDANNSNYGQDSGYNDNNNVQDVIIPGSQRDFVNSIMSDRIFFDTDRFNIDSQDQAALASQAQWLNRYPNVSIVVEGHADERGTRDYNLALGERRANSAKNYLISLGVNASRIRTISYGKERPQALGSDEQAWAQNRRAVTVTVQ
ncbi:peptidoglycan-associated lipoprotein [Sphingorhabdus lutea]|uniref:Peptidoglycan-associated lipoprotein n=1 Tax=Sphingorhabdus lutea TaxID=1913578 RepID=A0A1L3JFC3_9SPHN|nr:peptidoglycan-associated lipoprotein [Sphingorhabdus lutea]